MKQRLLKFISRFTGSARIPAGTGVSCDDNVVLTNPVTKERVEAAGRQTKLAYKLRNPEEVGGFEVVGNTRKGGLDMIRLRHTLTGTTFDVTRTLWDLIFVSPNK
jgi:hypothetical protein